MEKILCVISAHAAQLVRQADGAADRAAPGVAAGARVPRPLARGQGRGRQRDYGTCIRYSLSWQTRRAAIRNGRF